MSSLIVPPIRAPLLDEPGDRTCARDWYLFFHQLQRRISEPMVQSVVSGERELDVTYRNESIKPLMVAVTLRCTSAGGANFGEAYALTDDQPSPETVVAATFNGSTTATVGQHLTFYVVPGNYYRVLVVTPTVALTNWVEWT